jgi:hypothetical protein
VEFANDRQHLRIVPQILRRASTQQENGLAITYTDFGEVQIGLQLVALPFDICVPARFEVVHDKVQSFARWSSNPRLVAGFAEAMDSVQRRIRLAAITRNHQNSLHCEFSGKALALVFKKRFCTRIPFSAREVPCPSQK